MAQTARNTIKQWFKTGLKPTQTQFWSWLDSYWHKDDVIPQSQVQDLTATLAAKAEAAQFNSHLADPDAHAAQFAEKANDADISAVGKSNDYNDLDNIPAEYLPAPHTHNAADINGIDNYALRTYVQGLDIEFNPTTAELTLKDGEGNIFTTLSLAALNNEGTTITYNEDTGNLELRNDADELLSSFPASALVANLVHSANFNAGTPSQLDFKDSTGTTVFSVNFTINNISGLTAALAGKFNNPTGNGTQYLDGSGAPQNTATTVRGITLTGMAIVNAVVSATDTVLAAFGKLQGQVNAILTDLATKIAKGADSEIDINKLSVMNSLPGEEDSGTLYFVKDNSEEVFGKVSVTAPGGTTVTIPHNLAATPVWFNITAANSEASGDFYTTADGTNIILNYTGAAPAGTLNYNIAYRS